MSVKMTQKQFIELWRQEELEVDGVTYNVAEQDDWDGAGEKYQTLDVIITDGERFYRGTITKSGSYFTDWNYDDYGNADIKEVRKVERTYTVEEWRAV